MVKNLKLSLLLALLAVIPAAVFCPAVDLELSAQEVVAQEVVAQEEGEREADEAALNNQGNLNDLDLSDMNPESFGPDAFDPGAMEAFRSSDEGKKFQEEAEKFMKDMQENNPEEFKKMIAMTQELMGGEFPEEEMNKPLVDASTDVASKELVQGQPLAV